MSAEENILNLEQLVFSSACFIMVQVFFTQLFPLRLTQPVERQDVNFEQPQLLHKCCNSLNVVICIVETLDHR